MLTQDRRADAVAALGEEVEDLFVPTPDRMVGAVYEQPWHSVCLGAFTLSMTSSISRRGRLGVDDGQSFRALTIRLPAYHSRTMPHSSAIFVDHTESIRDFEDVQRSRLARMREAGS